MQYDELVTKLRKAAGPDTSMDPDGWTKENPLWGHCAVASLVAQDYFGGELMRGSLENTPKYAHLRSHYWNRINGEDIDFSGEQYPDISFHDLESELRTREHVLSRQDTVRRYQLLKERIEEQNK